MELEIFFILAICLVAFLYSSVGHGGASGYLALMALFGIEVVLMKPSALIMNLFVSSIAFISFYRSSITVMTDTVKHFLKRSMRTIAVMLRTT